MSRRVSLPGASELFRPTDDERRATAASRPLDRRTGSGATPDRDGSGTTRRSPST